MGKKQKRPLEVLILSDIHLGTFGCKAKALLQYLQTVDPEVLILNGDIIDIWQFNKHYFPKTHMKVIKYLCNFLTKGKKVYYITGNHDEMLRKFSGLKLGGFELVNKLTWEFDGKKAWIFHGDVFDVTMKHSKWLAKLGGFGYDFLIVINNLVNWMSLKLGRGRISLSKRIKDSVKGAVKFINNFEQTAADIAIDNHYDFVICGHIHQPQIRCVNGSSGGEVIYLNSGDWIENMTALEYVNGSWSLYRHPQEDKAITQEEENQLLEASHEFETEYLFNQLMKEFTPN